MSERKQARKRGWWYPWLFVGMFAVVIAVNLTLAWFASSTFAGLQTEGAYVKGLAYNQTLAQAQAQERLGWTVAAEATAAGAGAAAVVAVDVRDSAGRPVEGLEVQAHLSRPATSGQDRSLGLTRRAPGAYRGEVLLPLAGQWELQVVARRGEEVYQLGKRVVIR